MHGTEHCIQERRTPRRSAPLKPISPPRINASRHAAVVLPQRSRTLVTAFLSPATALPFSGLHSGVKGPGLLLRFPPARLPRPVRLSAPLPVTGSPQFTAASSLQARCDSRRRLAQLLPLPPLPSRTFTSLGIEAFNRIRRLRPAFRIRPISSRSPQPFLFLVLAADHRSWFATFPEACCSSNLLEPSSLCSSSPFFVNGFCVSINTISSTFIYRLFRYGYSQ